MGENSRIAWTDHTYNAFIGCTKVGVGCIGCYAAARDVRFDGGVHWGPGAQRRRTIRSTRMMPYKWNREAERKGIVTKVFAHSLSDVFDNEVPDSWREEEFEIWRNTPHLRWIVLTKRPGNIMKMLPKDWDPATTYNNVGFCCSVSTQEEFDRDALKIAHLSHSAAWVGVSIEPQVELIRLHSWCEGHLSWVITGGASAQVGYDPPPYDVEWARSLISECARFEIACFVKQLGSNPYDGSFSLKAHVIRSGGDPALWPPDVCVREFPEQLTR